MSEAAARVLVVEDEDSLRRVARHNLAQAGYEVLLAPDGREGLRLFEEQAPDAVLTDVRMPGLTGEALMDEVLRRAPETPVVVMTGYGTVRQAVEAMKRGAADYLTKPVDWEEVLVVLQRALERTRLVRENRRLRGELRERTDFGNIIGESPAMQALFGTLRRLLEPDVTVLLEGESGTGKELVAQALHYQGPRSQGPFVAVNCGAVPRNLVEAELFGHEKGAFTGAVRKREGAFQRARGGTLFLDEVAEIPLACQPALLRALSERVVQPVGGDRPVPVDARVVAATNRDLLAAVAAGDFREDLYFRLAVVPVSLPPLRARGADAVLIARRLLQERAGTGVRLTSEAEQTILAYSWPGNVRELRNALERAVVLREDPACVDAGDLPEHVHRRTAPAGRILGGRFPDEGLDLAQVERDCIIGALEKAGGNQTQAARLLNITRQTLIYRMSKFGLRPDTGEETPASGA